MRRRAAGTLTVLATALVAVLAVAVVARGGIQEPFPHEAHSGLFPFCTGCHVGVPDGDMAGFYPEPQLCSRCHDGVEMDSVDWTPPPVGEPSPVRFAHETHIPLECADCHVPPGGQPMQVNQRLVLEQCLSCHGGEQHFVDAPCATCHGPAAETPMGGEWLAGLPYPPDHATGTFLPEDHGQLAGADPARCAVCHTQERCTSCHVNAADVPEIATIPEAAPSLDLPRYAAHYVAPPSHQASGFLDMHGDAASAQACATCHTQDDCAACHAAEAPTVVYTMPRATDVMAPGVLLETRPPSTHQSASFIDSHGGMAAADAAACVSCHTRNFCAECHDASAVEVTLPGALAGGGFHPPNFMARHSTAAYGRQLECSSCHNTAAFCRDCHEQVGFGTTGYLDPGFHDAEPNWLLRHGQPARQALESCATCHAQTDCIQCHSELGSFKVSPHGPDFDPQRAHERNPAICLACHVNDPIG